MHKLDVIRQMRTTGRSRRRSSSSARRSPSSPTTKGSWCGGASSAYYRSTTFFQYKGILKHADVLAPHALGGSSTRGYDPDADLWELLW
jgi:hypothetical protein